MYIYPFCYKPVSARELKLGDKRGSISKMVSATSSRPSTVSGRGLSITGVGFKDDAVGKENFKQYTAYVLLFRRPSGPTKRGFN